MAQTEDTELRDMVIEALEKNGSLAKIRALLRANIFLAFEDECENMRHNMSLDSILKVPEGICALSIIHEFLEFCNLKNTLFVYKSESRQGKDYKYEGKKALYDKLNLSKQGNDKEPILLTLVKNTIKLNINHNDNIQKKQDCGDNVYKDDQNSSYIVHEDSQSSTTSTSQSDNSIDEKNKLHLRLHLDNSDTDTSTDSSRGKSASEYIPSEHVMKAHDIHNSPRNPSNTFEISPGHELSLPNYFSKVAGNTSSDSTSYRELKPFSYIDEKMLNTSGLPTADVNHQQDEKILKKNSDNSKSDSGKSATLSSVSSLSMKNDNQRTDMVKKLSQESGKSDGETGDYSYDFSTSHGSRNKENSENKKSPDTPKDFINETNKNSPIASPHLNSHSSISLSDVADLISEKSSSFDQHSNEKSPHKSNILSNSSKKKSTNLSNKLNSDDSGDYTESPVPSLSNLSLDIHSD